MLVFAVGFFVGYMIPTSLKITLIYLGDVIVWAFVILLIATIQELFNNKCDIEKSKKQWKNFIDFCIKGNSNYFTDGIVAEILFEMVGGSSGFFYYFFPATFLALAFSTMSSEITEKMNPENIDEELKNRLKNALGDLSETMRKLGTKLSEKKSQSVDETNNDDQKEKGSDEITPEEPTTETDKDGQKENETNKTEEPMVDNSSTPEPVINT